MRRTVLVVDDDPLVKTVMVETIDTLGFRPVAAESAAAAVGLLENGLSCHVMVADVMMAEMNGIELAKQAVLIRPDLQVILTSGYPLDPVTIPSQYSFIAKPFDAETLDDLLRRVLA